MNTIATSYALIVACLAALCIAGYASVFYIFYRKPKLFSNNILLVSLAVSDAFILIRCLRTVLTCLQIWKMTDSACQDDAFVAMAFTLISLSTAASISAEKYNSVCITANKQSKIVQIVKNYIGGLFFAALPLYGINSYGYETDVLDLRVSCLLNFGKPTVAGILYIFAIFTFYYARSLYEIFFNYKRCSELTSVSKSQNVSFKAQSLIPLQIIISLSPYAIFGILSTFGVIQNPQWYLYAIINNLMAKLFVATNPFVYILTDSELNSAFKELTGIKNEVTSSDSERKRSD